MVVMVLVACFVSSAAASTRRPVNPHCGRSAAPILCAIHRNYRVANYWRGRMSLPAYGYAHQAERQPYRRRYLLWFWRGRRVAAKRLYLRWSRVPWLHGAWYESAMCVHRLEGAWNDPNAPFYGGFQYMQSTWIASGGLRYASRADLASPVEQLRVTYGVTTRYGWGQWPNTARECGLVS